MSYKIIASRACENNGCGCSTMQGLIGGANIALGLVRIYGQLFTAISVGEVIRAKFFNLAALEGTAIALFTGRKSKNQGSENYDR